MWTQTDVREVKFTAQVVQNHAYAYFVTVPYFFNVSFELLLKAVFLTLLEVGEVIGPVCNPMVRGVVLNVSVRESFFEVVYRSTFLFIASLISDTGFARAFKSHRFQKPASIFIVCSGN